MPCHSPLEAYRKIGQPGITFKRKNTSGIPIQIPCGNCLGCRLDTSQEWTIRCIHEASLWRENIFLTLTYNDDHLPWDMGLRKEDLQKFIKRLRKSETRRRIRYYGCGEYGDQNLRPHYHLLLFNYDFGDKQIWQTKNDQYSTFRSEKLEQLWPFGFATFGEVTAESAGYTARYCHKKIGGPKAEKHYQRIIQETGEVKTVIPEFHLMSRNPGVGAYWYDLHKHEIAENDFVRTKEGKKKKVPKFYINKLKKDEPKKYEALKTKRMALIKKKAAKGHYSQKARDQQAHVATKWHSQRKREL